MFLLVLFFAGSDDVIAVAVGSSVIAIRTILRVLSFAYPPVTFVLVFPAVQEDLRRRRRRSHAPAATTASASQEVVPHSR